MEDPVDLQRKTLRGPHRLKSRIVTLLDDNIRLGHFQTSTPCLSWTKGNEDFNKIRKGFLSLRKEPGHYKFRNTFELLYGID